MKNTLRQMRAVANVAARSNLAYLGEVASRTLFLAVILFIFLKLWQATFRESGGTVIGGFTLAQMLWYLTVTEAITMSAPRLAQQIDEDVRSGTLAVRLLKPMSYPLYCLSSALGERAVRFAFNLLAGGLVTLLLVGPIECGAFALPVLISSVALAFVIDSLCHLIIGLGAFWLEDTSGIVLIYSRLSMILGGMLIPVALFPDWLQTATAFMPFRYVVWGPAQLFVRPDWHQFAALLFAQSLHIIALALLASLVYNRALQRISAHGG
jgi:ABC-2 type transport system permease protein